MSERVFTAAVIIIGNEILSGRTQDTNLREIAISLGAWGIRVGEARVIPDVEATIVATVNELRAKHDYVLTTGGIGPTHDDITAECIAKAFDVPLVEHPRIAAFIRQREAPPDVMKARLRMAMIPQGGGLIANSTGGPPGFSIGNVYVMAGVPSVMRAMLASLQTELQGGAVVQSRSITAYVLESVIAHGLGELQAAFPSVEIGSYPFTQEGRHGTTLVMRATDVKLLDDVAQKVRMLIIATGAQPTDDPTGVKREPI